MRWGWGQWGEASATQAKSGLREHADSPERHTKVPVPEAGDGPSPCQKPSYSLLHLTSLGEGDFTASRRSQAAMGLDMGAAAAPGN